jgi:16S rRNA A1518/A1519 N6-dimethyltransferase RsmA/KsgA/DIM1 with predicted DNA glycosylase/AP lyase activity
MSGGEQAAMGQSGFMRPVVIKNRFKPPPEVLAAVVSEISRAKRPRECRGNKLQENFDQAERQNQRQNAAPQRRFATLIRRNPPF